MLRRFCIYVMGGLFVHCTLYGLITNQSYGEPMSKDGGRTKTAIIVAKSQTTSHTWNPLPGAKLLRLLSKVVMSTFSVTPHSTPQNSCKDFPNMTLMVRTSTLPKHLYRYYCLYLRSLLLFWPAAYGNLAVVLDAEYHKDHVFGNRLTKQMKTHYPDYKLNVYYESLPRHPQILKNRPRSAGYNRQLWSTFFSDLYTNESIIAYMDTNALFVTPMIREYLIKGEKLKVFGNGVFQHWAKNWDMATRKALGLPEVRNFMTTFPQLIYRDTIRNCRKHILKHCNMSDFEKAWNVFHPQRGSLLSPFVIIMTYAWFYEKDRYDWHLKVPNLRRINSRLPDGHKVLPEDMVGGVVGVAHTKKWHQELITPGYCLSMSAQGQHLKGCENVKHNLTTICDFEKPYPWPGSWCPKGRFQQCCLNAVDAHYKEVARMASLKMHHVQRSKAELVEKLAAEVGMKCEPLNMP